MVYNSKDELLNEETAPADMGTYNYMPFIAKENPPFNTHFAKDVFPYFLRGNLKGLSYDKIKYMYDESMNGYAKFR